MKVHKSLLNKAFIFLRGSNWRLIIFVVMNCKNCNKCNCIKRGKRNGIQRYFCKSCNSYFQEAYSYIAYQETTNTLIKSMLKEGCGVLSISRIIGISKNTVLSRMLKISNQIKAPYFNKLGCKFEIDELWTYIKQKDNFTWITYVIERETKQVIDFFVGSKSKENIRPLIHKVLCSNLIKFIQID
ncbi:hypothetical protein GCM10011531_28100 [Aquaticitalea lipolytica]|uniref:Transposase n=1 Tax=Aquaticitalea lipolytica TaxID=1247562 RepID=A0A8J2TUB5_9FLAO|nr:IS1 family transposase [Aquaticitalea lipolytica]GFZ94779.1 hypothetical protein GCM10011531_28100 [Aquaticitalea lipolytica]